MLSIALSLTTN